MPMIRKLPLLLATIHLISVFVMGALIANSPDGSAVMAWLLYIPIDFPVSLGMVPLSYLVDGNEILSRIDSSGNYSIYRDIDNFWFPAVYIGLVGTVWWYVLATLIRRFIWWFREKRSI